MPTRTDLNVRQTAALLGVHENTVRNWVAHGILRAYRLPGSGYRRFRHDEVERVRARMLADAGNFAPIAAEPLQTASDKLATV